MNWLIKDLIKPIFAISNAAGQKLLVHGLQVKTIDNINVAFDNDTIGHWFEENKLLNDISGRLKKLPCGCNHQKSR